MTSESSCQSPGLSPTLPKLSSCSSQLTLKASSVLEPDAVASQFQLDWDLPKIVTSLGKAHSHWTFKGSGRAQGVWSKFVSAMGGPLGLGTQSQAPPISPSRPHFLLPSSILRLRAEFSHVSW